MRLDKYVSQCSGLSRKSVKQVLHQRRIAVDGEPVRNAGLILCGEETVTLDGHPLALPRARYLMLHKPAGVVCATEDSSQRTVLDLLPSTLATGQQIVGRLDKDTTGLLLLTDDGQWNHRITSPRRACAKVYQVTTADPIEPSAIDAFHDGIVLKDDPKPTQPATLVIEGSHQASITLVEGRYHQVKRMFAALGNRVTALHRASIGSIRLDPELPEGQFRSLTEDEINCV
ncbi:pseudouridine synthase [Marinimicrobium agarilyticum]|uniref:pseudouridine synthase n=1 Tax=Marinimicrobium agarilyticum TaxID=306546 RepID=UPI0003F795F1|nr:16S rRNA pseudouridine(516) synthase [Marinimicrobium agarilyticum]